MMIYSHNVSLAEWASVYEAYYTNALRACHGKPTVVVQHADLVANPFGAVTKLHKDLTAAGVTGLALPAEDKVLKLIRPSAEKKAFYLASERNTVGPAAQALSDTLSKWDPTAHKEQLKPAEWLITPRKAKQAFATLLTTDNADYLRGALVLGSSIRTFDSSRDMVALVTEKVPAEWHASLTVAGWTVHVVPEIEEFWWGRSEECSRFAADQGERWGHMATKLRLWELTQYERVLYLDADTILTGPVAKTFDTVTTFAAEAPKYHAHFNAGVLMLTPSTAVFNELITLGQQPHASRFGNVIDCTEQGLLNTYYNGDKGREVTKLPIGRADVKADWASEDAPFAVHWITHVCPKPWRIADGAEPLEAHCDANVYSYWRRVWDRLTASSKDEQTGQSVGSREQARRKMRRLTGVVAGPSLVGRARVTPMPSSMGELWSEVRNGVGRQLRSVMNRRELRRRRYEYDTPWSEGTWAWIAIIGTLALGLAAGALLHKLFIKTPDQVGKGMTVVQAKRMGFQALGEGRGPVGVVSAVDDDDDDDDDEDEEEAPPAKKGGKK
jgi:glycogenin glucosyltransferase